MHKALCLFGLFTLFTAAPSFAAEVPRELRSRLDQIAQVDGVGAVAYRAPKDENKGPVLVLMHGVYGGASHRAFREILPILDQRGFRVYLFDLPGTGDSVKKDQKYTIESLETSLASFLREVVREPAVVVAESVAGVAALEVAKQEPAQVRGVVMLQPTGIRTLAKPASIPQEFLYKSLRASDLAARKFYEALSSEASVRYYAKKAYYNDALVDDLRVAEGTLAGENLDQRWITISFVGGQIYKPFKEAAAGVKQPVLALFGEKAEPIGGGKDSVERPEEFKAAMPELQVKIVPNAGASMQREKPLDTAAAIEDFAR